jgi:NapC/NirT cytochrome c family, N-terminal region
MPVGALWRRRQLKRAGQLPETYPKVDFTQETTRHAFGWTAGLTALNLVLFGSASYRGVEYMDSAKFCGQTCHTVMQPEFTAYQNSPHQRVACVDCHIGPGAGWFVRSKLSGVRQVFAVTFHTYDRPIPTPVEQLRPARETCEQCHWPQMFTGDKLVVRTSYKDDKKNTPQTTVLLLKIGGREAGHGVGIHGKHLDRATPIEYVATDRQRQTIAEVIYEDGAGKRSEFVSSDSKPTAAQLAAGERRTMDCVDCHNRPTHVFQLPDRAVDQALAEGSVSTDLPFIKKMAVEVLKADYPDRDTASRSIAGKLDQFYRTTYPDVYRDKRPVVDQAIAGVQAIYLRNVFPAMKVSWGTYPNNLGHMDFPGCFRCHDGSHTTADGRTIPNDCDTCHTLLAVDETNPKILADLGVK